MSEKSSSHSAVHSAAENAEAERDTGSEPDSGSASSLEQQPAAGAGKRIEDVFTLQLLDDLRCGFSEAQSPGSQPRERVLGGQMTLLQFSGTVSYLLETDEFSSQLRVLFEKLDTRGSGLLSWSKFCSHLLTYLREKTQAERRSRQALQEKPKFARSPYSKSVTVLLVYVESIKRYLLVSKDGVISVWTRDLTPVVSCKLQSLLPGPIKLKGAPSYKPKAKVWVTSAVFYSELSKLVLSTTSSDIYFVSFLPPSSFIAQYQLTELPSPAFSLAPHEQSGMLLLLCGCADGSLLVLRFLSPQTGLFSQDVSSKREECIKVSGRNLHKYQQFVTAATYQVHNQWVRRIEYLPSLQSAISCSHSPKVSLAITDLQRIKQPYLFSLPKGVSCFCYSQQLSILLTGSVDRIVRVWCPYVPFKPTALLMGHDAFILDVMVYYPKRVFLSIDTGGMVRIWDAIWNNCIQFVQLLFPLPSNSWEFGQRCFFTGELSSSLHSTCANYVASFGLVPGTGDSEFQGIRGSCSLKAAPCAALYAPTFSLVLVGSEDSSIYTYDIYTGRRLYVIPSAHGSEEITAMCIDHSGRRLITGSRLGQAKGWDVTTGELMQTFLAASPNETTSLVPLGKKNLLFSAGWAKEIVTYKDRPEKVDKEEPHVWQDSRQHTEDILCATLSFPYLVTGSYDGMLILWNTETEKELSRARSGIKARVDGTSKRAPSRQGDSLIDNLQRPSSHKLSSRERGRKSPSRLNHRSVAQEESVPIDALLFLKERLSLRIKNHLISSEGGYAVFWDIFHFSRCRQTIRLTRYPNETVLGIATDPLNTLLISGDTRGEVRVFSLSTAQTKPAKASISSQQLQGLDCISVWRAHDSSIVSVEYVPGEGTQSFVLTASVDRNVRLWTLDGKYVGNFGTQFWDLRNPTSYQHPKNPWGSTKHKVQIISRASSRESHVSILNSSLAVSRVTSVEDLALISKEASDIVSESPLPSLRGVALFTQSSKFFSLQPNPNLEPELLTDSEKQLHINDDMLMNSKEREVIEERMKRRSVRRSRFQSLSIDKTERFPMVCSAYQALELSEIISPDLQPISLPPISQHNI